MRLFFEIYPESPEDRESMSYEDMKQFMEGYGKLTEEHLRKLGYDVEYKGGKL